MRAARLQVTVRGVIDETADEHLDQLTGRDEHGNGLRRPVAHCPARVIRVHHRVHRVVHHDEPSGGRRELVVRKPRVHQHGDVMVPVQEDERLFSQHDEYGVAQFGKLGQHEQPRPEAGHRIVFDVAVGGKKKTNKQFKISVTPAGGGVRFYIYFGKRKKTMDDMPPQRAQVKRAAAIFFHKKKEKPLWWTKRFPFPRCSHTRAESKHCRFLRRNNHRKKSSTGREGNGIVVLSRS